MNERTSVNYKSILAFLLGLTSIFAPAIGLILGIAGIVISRMSLKEIKQSMETGYGLAISGLILSIFGIIIQSIVIFFILVLSNLTNFI